MNCRENIKLRMEKDEILEFAVKQYNKHKKARWNRRQIRNTFQSALAMAEYDALHLGTPSDTDMDDSDSPRRARKKTKNISWWRRGEYILQKCTQRVINMSELSKFVQK